MSNLVGVLHMEKHSEHTFAGEKHARMKPTFTWTDFKNKMFQLTSVHPELLLSFPNFPYPWLEQK
jgi:hypothetical protein